MCTHHLHAHVFPHMNKHTHTQSEREIERQTETDRQTVDGELLKSRVAIVFRKEDRQTPQFLPSVHILSYRFPGVCPLVVPLTYGIWS